MNIFYTQYIFVYMNYLFLLLHYCILFTVMDYIGASQWLRWQRIYRQSRKPRFNSWVGKIPFSKIVFLLYYM